MPPIALHTLPISLENEIMVASTEFDVYLIISAVELLVTRTCAFVNEA